MKVVYGIFLIFLTKSTASPTDYLQDNLLTSNNKDDKNVEDYGLLTNLLIYAAKLDEDELDKFLTEEVTDEDIELITDNNKSRQKRELPEWAKLLIKCTVHIFFPQLELPNLINDVEALLDKERDANTIINEMSNKYENMEEQQPSITIENGSVEGIKIFFKDSCVRDAINYAIKNREKIKEALKKSVKWAKSKVRKLRESRTWNKIRGFFRRGD